MLCWQVSLSVRDLTLLLPLPCLSTCPSPPFPLPTVSTGQLVAIAFLEWCTANPSGVVALPTGRTPEYFIKTLERYRMQWGQPALVSELTALGYSPSDAFPDLSKLTFVMLDEFFPISTEHRNSFCNYIRNFYVGPLGIDPKVRRTHPRVR